MIKPNWALALDRILAPYEGKYQEKKMETTERVVTDTPAVKSADEQVSDAATATLKVEKPEPKNIGIVPKTGSLDNQG